MEKISGEPLRNVWKTLSDTSKAAIIIRDIAGFILQIRRNCVFFHQIGALYHDDDKEGFTIGPIIVTHKFAFIGARRQILQP